jgi:transcriptional regulator GlxA family with amidase domain
MDWRARKLKEFIDSQPGKVRWNLDDVCKQLGLPVSGRQARRVFRRAIRIGFKEYLKKSRLGFAAEQLKTTTTVPIKAIAADAGYERAAEFGRSFKRVFLVSPTEFRTVWHQNKRAAQSPRPISMKCHSELSDATYA